MCTKFFAYTNLTNLKHKVFFMKSASTWSALCAFSLISAAVNADVRPKNYEIDRHWSVLAEYVYMERSHVDNRRIVKDSSDLRCVDGCPSTVVISAKNLVNDLGYTSGGRIGLSYKPDTKSIYQTRFMYIAPWAASKTVYGDNTLSFPFHTDTFTEDYNYADKAKAHLTSQFYTFDLNYWRNSARRGLDYFVISGVFGIRFFQLEEKLKLAFYNDTVQGNTKSNYNAKTLNDTIGIQGGFNFQMNPYKQLSFDFLALGGLGLNRAYENVFLGDVNNTVIIREFTKQNGTSVVFADTALQVGYQFFPCMNMHIGYQLFYACGQALAAQQLSFSVNPSNERFIDTGYVIIHGLLVGFNFDF